MPRQIGACKDRPERSILGQGWGAFRRQLDYKLRWNGGALVLVSPRDTSIKCSKCGFTSKENRQTQSIFTCLDCGYDANADTNAAANILERGLKMLKGQDFARIACGDSQSESVKQEAQLTLFGVSGKVPSREAGEHVI